MSDLSRQILAEFGNEDSINLTRQERHLRILAREVEYFTEQFRKTQRQVMNMSKLADRLYCSML